MMRNIVLFCLLVTLAGCGSTKKMVDSHASERVNESVIAKDSAQFTRIVTDDNRLVDDYTEVIKEITLSAPDSTGRQYVTSVVERERVGTTKTTSSRKDSVVARSGMISEAHRESVMDNSIKSSEDREESRQLLYVGYIAFCVAILYFLYLFRRK